MANAKEFTNRLYKRPAHLAPSATPSVSMDAMEIGKHAVIPSTEVVRMRVWRLYHRLWV